MPVCISEPDARRCHSSTGSQTPAVYRYGEQYEQYGGTWTIDPPSAGSFSAPGLYSSAT